MGLENILHNLNPFMFSRVVLWPVRWFHLVTISCAFKNNVYFSVIGLSILSMSVSSSWVIVLFTFLHFLKKFCLPVLSRRKEGLLESLTITIHLSLSPEGLRLRIVISS